MRAWSSFPTAGASLPDPRAATIHRRQSHRRTHAVKKRFAVSLLTALALAGAFPRAAAGQPPEYQPPAGPTPRTAAGKVDFSGVWSKPYVPDVTKDGRGQKGVADLPFTPWGEAEWKNYD